MGFEKILKRFLHDPIDKAFGIRTHEQRAKEYAELLDVTEIDEAKGSDWIASSMERSLLPKDIKQSLTEIRHPLSNEKIDVPITDIEDIKKFLANIYTELGNEVKNKEDKIKFLFIWRNLLELIEEKSKEKPFGKFWSVIPADTRIPDHSIWEHIKISSAINAYEQFQNNSLFLFTIGPVQSFISQARKTQDLFMGSFLLSYLTFIAIEKLIADLGPTAIIFPDLYSQPLMDWYLEHKAKIRVENSFANFVHYPTIPNRFVAIVPETEIEKIGKELEVTVRNEWKKIVNQILDAFEIKLNEDTIKRQILDFPQIYWVIIPWKIGTEDIKLENLNCFIDHSEIDRWKNLWDFATKNGEYPPNIGFLYQLLYTSLEKSMGMRKNLRNFEQSSEPGRKCSICGEKEALIENGTGKLTIGKFISEKERLCVVCFAKRGLEKYLIDKFGSIFRDFNFPSTAEVALSDFKEKALYHAKDEFKKCIEKFNELTKDKFSQVNPLPALKESFNGIENLEGEWFFEKNLTEKAIKKYLGIEIEKGKIDELKKYLKQIADKIGIPNPYYAVIMLDGDNMGKWLSGENLPNIESAYNSQVWQELSEEFKRRLKELSPRKFLTPAIHSAISIALKNYSIEFVRKIVEEEHLGKLVYAGGDDVLALVNLKDLFEVMRKLRAAFSGQIQLVKNNIAVDWNRKSGFIEKNGSYILTMGKNATASIGVVIAHYKEPLRIVLTKARKALKIAKNQMGKDSYAITLLKHSGEERNGTSRWQYNDLDTIEVLKTLSEIMDPSKKPHLSDKFIFNLRQAFEKILEKDGHFSGNEQIFNVELKRIICRAYDETDKEKKKNLVDEFSTKLEKIFWNTGADLKNFLSLIEVASFIKRKI